MSTERTKVRTCELGITYTYRELYDAAHSAGVDFSGSFDALPDSSKTILGHVAEVVDFTGLMSDFFTLLRP